MPYEKTLSFVSLVWDRSVDAEIPPKNQRKKYMETIKNTRLFVNTLFSMVSDKPMILSEQINSFIFALIFRRDLKNSSGNGVVAQVCLYLPSRLKHLRRMTFQKSPDRVINRTVIVW